jgi:DNA-binding transcriptional regulator LsrR (DeoR family)
LVEKLPLRRREIFIKSRFEGLSIREIAEELKISHKTVENQLTEALKFIRTNLNKEYIPAVLFFYAVCFLILSELFRIFDCRIVLFKKNGLSTAISGHLARC